MSWSILTIMRIGLQSLVWCETVFLPDNPTLRFPMTAVSYLWTPMTPLSSINSQCALSSYPVILTPADQVEPALILCLYTLLFKSIVVIVFWKF